MSIEMVYFLLYFAAIVNSSFAFTTNYSNADPKLGVYGELYV